ncbi:MAG: 30S ribosomal protein S2 [Candidatus Aenigmatarchaeota archaeon]
MLVDKNTYLTSGIYIGMKTCTPYLKQFVYRTREDGLDMFNLKKIDDRLKVAGQFLATFKKILVVSKKDAAGMPIQAFSKATGVKGITGRFPPGMLTNPLYEDFYEPDVIVVIDPLIDDQVIKEAEKKRIPIIGLCNTFNQARNIDLVIPLNNNGKKSLALAFWIIAREYLKTTDKIKKDSDFKMTLEDFGGEA